MILKKLNRVRHGYYLEERLLYTRVGKSLRQDNVIVYHSVLFVLLPRKKKSTPDYIHEDIICIYSNRLFKLDNAPFFHTSEAELAI